MTASIPPAPVPALNAPAPGELQPSSPFAPGIYQEQGIASWYGYPFHGRRASNGEIFDMNQPVAAHRTLPFGSMVRVTNLNNGLSTDVRVIDRGPFVGNRVIDLSFAAATAIKMIGPGTAQVRLDLLSSPAPVVGYFAVQVGSFQQKENAESVRSQFVARYPVAVQLVETSGGRYYRVRIGLERTQADAAQLAAVLVGERGFTTTFVVRLDDVH